MDTFREYIASAIKTIRSNRIRTLLTMLGIIIGIASVVAIITLGNGMSDYVQKQIESTGSSIISIYLSTSATDERFTQDDINAVKEAFPEIRGGSFYNAGEGAIIGKKGAGIAQFEFVGSDYNLGNGNGIKYGRYISEAEVDSAATVCVLVAADAKKLCGTENAVGMTVELNVDGRVSEFEIVGIQNDFGEMIMKLLEMVDNPAIVDIPYTTAENTFGIDASSSASIEFYSGRAEAAVSPAVIQKFLENKKGLRGQDALYYYDTATNNDEISEMMGLITTFMSIVAAISLLVGGIGVMNIMLVSVTERTREIGIRKSIGARTGSILVQFLAESSIISLLGGIIGVVFGLIAAAFACKAVNFAFIMSPSSVVLATTVSIAIGIFFGIYPARKAAHLTPVEALSQRK
ncbi:MAG: ABC transporter permease [Lachnospiraceae bacterium]|nr:ABC transporter permease [Lachnospiraceae bacterium]